MTQIEQEKEQATKEENVLRYLKLKKLKSIKKLLVLISYYY